MSPFYKVFQKVVNPHLHTHFWYDNRISQLNVAISH